MSAASRISCALTSYRAAMTRHGFKGTMSELTVLANVNDPYRAESRRDEAEWDDRRGKVASALVERRTVWSEKAAA